MSKAMTCVGLPDSCAAISPRMCGVLAGFMSLYPALAQSADVGPGTINTTIIVGSGLTTVVGGTTVQTPGYAASVSGGTLVLDPSASIPGPIVLNATNFNSFAIYSTGGLVDIRDGATFLSTTGAASSALWTQNAAASAVSVGGLNIHTTGGYGIVGGLPVGSYGVSASHNSSISLTNANILTEGVGAAGAYALGSRMSLNGVNIETRGSAYSDGTGTYGSYGAIANSLNGIRSTLSLTGGSLRTAGNTGYGLFALASDVTANGTVITTTGSSGYGVFARLGSAINATGLEVTTSGTNGYGVYAVEGSTITMQDSQIITQGGTGYGALSYGPNSRVNLTNVDISTVNGPGVTAWGNAASDNVQANVTGGTVQTLANNAHGLYVRGVLATITADSTRVSTAGQGAAAARVLDGTLTTNGATLLANGSDAAALTINANAGQTARAAITGGELRSAQSDAIAATSGSSQVNLTGTTVTGETNWLHVIGNPSVVADPFAEPEITTVANVPSSGLSGVGVNVIPSVSVTAPGASASTLVTASGATLNGAALTETGASSNVSLTDNTVWNLTGNSNVTSLSNQSSLIQFAPPVGSVFKTLTVTNYEGQNGTIGLNTFLANDDSPSDKVVIDGGNASGTSFLSVKNTLGQGALTTNNGILVVDSVNGGRTAAGAFALAGAVYAGPYEYTLHRSSNDTSNPEAWYLRSTIEPDPPVPPGPPVPPDPAPPGPPGPPEPVPPNPPVPVPPQPRPAPVPNFRPETSLYTAVPALALVYTRTLVDTLHERVGEERLNQSGLPAGDENTYGPSLGWGRLIYRSGKQEGSRQSFGGSTPEYNYDLSAFQVGLDLYRDVKPDGSHEQAGVSLAVGSIDAGVSHHTGNSAGEDTLRAYSLGGYWTYFGQNGWYLDSVLQTHRFDIEAKPNRTAKLKTRGWGYSASLEAGYPFEMKKDLYIEPQAQVIYSSVDLDDSDDLAAEVRFKDVDSLLGRVGVRFAKDWETEGTDHTVRRTNAWIRPSVWHEFKGQPKTEFSSQNGYVPFEADIGGSWGEVNVGIDYQTNARTTFTVSTGYRESFEGDSHGYDGMIGVKVTF